MRKTLTCYVHRHGLDGNTILLTREQSLEWSPRSWQSGTVMPADPAHSERAWGDEPGVSSHLAAALQSFDGQRVRITIEAIAPADRSPDVNAEG